MKIIVEVPEGWRWTDCFVCNGKKLCPASEDGPCPLRHAKEAVEVDVNDSIDVLEPVVEYPDREFAVNGHPVRLYAVKEDK